MKNWERILEMTQGAENQNHIFSTVVYDWCPIEIRERFDNEYKEGKYRTYRDERDLFGVEFYECFVSFLKYVKHWNNDKLIEYCQYQNYARSTALRYLREYREGDNSFELWLLGEEGIVKELSTQKRENIITNFEPEDLLFKDFDEIKPIKKSKCLAYIMYLYTDNEKIPTFLKVGKTSNITDRIKQLQKQYSLVKIEVINTFEFEDDETAEMMESFMRKFYKVKYRENFIPKDRFQNAMCTDKELSYFKKKAKLISAIAEL